MGQHEQLQRGDNARSTWEVGGNLCNDEILMLV